MRKTTHHLLEQDDTVAACMRAYSHPTQPPRQHLLLATTVASRLSSHCHGVSNTFIPGVREWVWHRSGLGDPHRLRCLRCLVLRSSLRPGRPMCCVRPSPHLVPKGRPSRVSYKHASTLIYVVVEQMFTFHDTTTHFSCFVVVGNEL